jgi:pimeloyl-ACP methyl ester carboxylesterase
MELQNIQWATTPDLDIAYEEWGHSNKEVVILLHGFPDDPRGRKHTLKCRMQSDRSLPPWFWAYPLSPRRYDAFGPAGSDRPGPP